MELWNELIGNVKRGFLATKSIMGKLFSKATKNSAAAAKISGGVLATVAATIVFILILAGTIISIIPLIILFQEEGGETFAANKKVDVESI